MIVGCFEPVTLPKLGVKSVLAKVDTGAYSGALHCTEIRLVKKDSGEQVLQFMPLGEPDLATETSHFKATHVRSATGHRVNRFLIETTIEIKGKTYPICIGLSDRSDMKRAVLIGRRFLRENNILVDVCRDQGVIEEGDDTR